MLDTWKILAENVCRFDEFARQSKVWVLLTLLSGWKLRAEEAAEVDAPIEEESNLEGLSISSNSSQPPGILNTAKLDFYASALYPSRSNMKVSYAAWKHAD